MKNRYKTPKQPLTDFFWPKYNSIVTRETYIKVSELSDKFWAKSPDNIFSHLKISHILHTLHTLFKPILKLQT